MMKRISLVIAVAAVAGLGAGATTAADFQKELIAYAKGELDVALKEWEPLAAAGDAQAQSHLGVMYVIGRGVERDHQKAAKLFRQSTDQNHAPGQYNLGLVFSKGQGVARNLAESIRLFRLAAAQNHRRVQNVGVMYRRGQGVPKDYKEAAKWFRLAAEKGLSPARFNLAIAYAKGQGVPQDYVQAHMWASLGRSQRYMRILARGMTPAQIAEAKKRAAEWKAPGAPETSAPAPQPGAAAKK